MNVLELLMRRYRERLIKRVGDQEVWVYERIWNSIIVLAPPGSEFHDNQW